MVDTDKLTEVLWRALKNKTTLEDIQFLNENKEELKELNDLAEALFGNFLINLDNKGDSDESN